VTPTGNILVAEDGGNMELVMLGPGRTALALLRVEDQAGSELTGPAFDPSGRRLYFSSQRGFDGDGITYEVRGPFSSQRGRRQGDRHEPRKKRLDRHDRHGRRDRGKH